MEIKNTRVFGLEESLIASGYPKSINTPNEEEFTKKTEILRYGEGYFGDHPETIGIFERGAKLGGVPTGTGHDCALKGIIVQADFTAPQYWWIQFGRYHFADIISSQSKMHRILNMDIEGQCNKWVDGRQIEVVEEYIDLYNNFELYSEVRREITLRDGGKEDFTKENLFHMIISNVPSGLNLTARITDNYLSIKTQYNQRKYHKMFDWSKDWKEWAEQLPLFKELCGIN